MIAGGDTQTKYEINARIDNFFMFYFKEGSVSIINQKINE